MAEEPVKTNPYAGHYDGKAWHCGCKVSALEETILMDNGDRENRSACRDWKCGFRVWSKDNLWARRAAMDKTPHMDSEKAASESQSGDTFRSNSASGSDIRIGNDQRTIVNNIVNNINFGHLIGRSFQHESLPSGPSFGDLRDHSFELKVTVSGGNDYAFQELHHRSFQLNAVHSTPPPPRPTAAQDRGPQPERQQRLWWLPGFWGGW